MKKIKSRPWLAGNGLLLLGLVMGMLAVTFTSSAKPSAMAADCLASSIRSNFNGTSIAGGRYIWFNSVMKVSGVPATGARLTFSNQTIEMVVGGQTRTLSVPDAVVTFDAGSLTASTTFDDFSRT